MMKPTLHVLALSALLTLTAGLVAASTDDKAAAPQADATEHKFELAQQYYAQCQNVTAEDFALISSSLRAFTDAEVMADTLADPARFLKLMNAVNDPRTLHVMMKCATEPVMWDTWMRGASDPDKMARAMGRFFNPGMYMAWMMAPMNPQVMAEVTAMADPNRYLNTWPTGLSNPTFYQPFYAWLDPAWQQPRVAWMANPASYQPMLDLFTKYATQAVAYAEPAPQAN